MVTSIMNLYFAHNSCAISFSLSRVHLTVQKWKRNCAIWHQVQFLANFGCTQLGREMIMLNMQIGCLDRLCDQSSWSFTDTILFLDWMYNVSKHIIQEPLVILKRCNIINRRNIGRGKNIDDIMTSNSGTQFTIEGTLLCIILMFGVVWDVYLNTMSKSRWGWCRGLCSYS
jgi:hypothetical protein